MLEKHMALRGELSVVLARDAAGATAVYPVAENFHANGILDVSVAPARSAPELAARAAAAATRIAHALDYRGVLCVEFFLLEDGRLIANEIAPRPHNSGHFTIDACACSQFEQQARVLADLPLGDTAMSGGAAMVNLLGELWRDGEPDWRRVERLPGARLHLYGKREARPGRKMGHITLQASSSQLAFEIAHEAKLALMPRGVAA